LARRSRPWSAAGSDADAELDCDFVAELERAEERRVGPDSPPRLDDRRGALNTVIGQPAVHGDGLGSPGDGQIAVDAERLGRPGDPGRPKCDRGVLPGVQDLLADRLLDLRAIRVGERLDTAGSPPDLERVGVDLDADRGSGHIRRIDADFGLPACDLDGQIVSGPRAEPRATGLDQQLTRVGPQRVAAVGDTHGCRLPRRNIDGERTAGCAPELRRPAGGVHRLGLRRHKASDRC